MARQRERRPNPVAVALPFDEARDEMFQHIMRCGVIGSDQAHQSEWFDETMKYLTERFHELSAVQLTELRVLGERFVQPPKSGRADEAEAVSAA